MRIFHSFRSSFAIIAAFVITSLSVLAVPSTALASAPGYSGKIPIPDMPISQYYDRDGNSIIAMFETYPDSAVYKRHYRELNRQTFETKFDSSYLAKAPMSFRQRRQPNVKGAPIVI